MLYETPPVAVFTFLNSFFCNQNAPCFHSSAIKICIVLLLPTVSSPSFSLSSLWVICYTFVVQSDCLFLSAVCWILYFAPVDLHSSVPQPVNCCLQLFQLHSILRLSAVSELHKGYQFVCPYALYFWDSVVQFWIRHLKYRSCTILINAVMTWSFQLAYAC